MNIKGISLKIVSLIYIYIPVLLFLFTWTHIVIAFACSIVWGICVYRIYTKTRDNKTKQPEYIKIDIVVFGVVIFLFLYIGYYAGWGRWVNQVYDWHKHNAVLMDLVNRSWPVYYHNVNEQSMLVYYIGQYLVPAAFGKIFHSYRFAEIVMYIWNEIGLVLVFLNILRILKIDSYVKQLFCAVIMPFFSIPLWVSELVLEYVSELEAVRDGHWFYLTDGILLQYSNNFALLRWVVPQVIVIWLIVTLFLESKEKIEYYVPLLLPGMLYGIFGFLGICVIAVAYSLDYLLKTKNTREWIRKIFSIENVLFLLTLGGLFFAYYYGNILGDKPKDISFDRMPYNSETIIVYVVFVIVNILIYAAIFWKNKRQDGIYYTVVVSLLVLPLCKMGQWNDFTMRTSIPALFILMIYILEFICNKMYNNFRMKSLREKVASMTVIVMLLSGMCYPLEELTSSIVAEDYETLGIDTEWKTLETFANRDLDVPDDVKYNYYAYEIEDNLFYKFFAKKQIE